MPLTTYKQSKKNHRKLTTHPHTKQAGAQHSFQKMLASTIQFSNNKPHHHQHQRKPPAPAPASHTDHTACSPKTQQRTSMAPPQTRKHDIPPMSKPPIRHSQMAWPTNIVELLRKEVIQPHLPVRLPCYDLVPIANPTFDGSPTRVRPPASGVTNFRDLTGGVYKARERIHRSVADLRLLATPTSWGRVADPNPN